MKGPETPLDCNSRVDTVTTSSTASTAPASNADVVVKEMKDAESAIREVAASGKTDIDNDRINNIINRLLPAKKDDQESGHFETPEQTEAKVKAKLQEVAKQAQLEYIEAREKEIARHEQLRCDTARKLIQQTFRSSEMTTFHPRDPTEHDILEARQTLRCELEHNREKLRCELERVRETLRCELKGVRKKMRNLKAQEAGLEVVYGDKTKLEDERKVISAMKQQLNETYGLN